MAVRQTEDTMYRCECVIGIFSENLYCIFSIADKKITIDLLRTEGRTYKMNYRVASVLKKLIYSVYSQAKLTICLKIFMDKKALITFWLAYFFNKIEQLSIKQ